MRNLTKLKYLSFASTEQLGIIPRGMMTNLWNLEILELQVPKSGDFDEEIHLNIDELRCLKQLKALDISISDSKHLDKFVSDPHLCICTSVLRVQWCKEITLQLSLEHFKQLRYLLIKNCSELKELFIDCIINNDEMEVGLFESLERMILGNLHCAHFRKLHSVFIDGCDAMVDLTWLLLIPKLQTLWILNCGGLQDILSSTDESGEAFSNLKTMILIDLPNLHSICSMNALPFPLLESILVRGCPKLRRLPLDSNSANKIEGDQEWLDILEWENETIKTRFKSNAYGVKWENVTNNTPFKSHAQGQVQ